MLCYLQISLTQNVHEEIKFNAFNAGMGFGKNQHPFENTTENTLTFVC